MPPKIDDNIGILRIEIENMTDQIPLGKQLKYALQEKEALQEMLKESTYEYFRMVELKVWYADAEITLKREQLLELTADFNRASEEVSELELIIFEAGAAEELVLLASEQALMWEEEKRDGEESLLRQQEWMDAMDTAYEEGCFENASSKSNI